MHDCMHVSSFFFFWLLILPTNKDKASDLMMPCKSKQFDTLHIKATPFMSLETKLVIPFKMEESKA